MTRIRAMTVVLFVVMLRASPFLDAAEAPVAKDDYVQRIYLANPDGSGMKPLVDLPEYKRQGSPRWSADGKLIAFDAWRPQMGEKLSDAKVVVVNVDGKNARILGDGAMPNFSPRGNRIAFSRYKDYGVWVMSSTGPDNECVLLDNQGWGADWSPDGTRIVYTTHGGKGKGANLVVYNLVEGTREPLFDAGTARYSSFFWHFKWSPDGRKIVFKGEREDGKKEIGIVDARGAKHGLVTRFEGDIVACFAYSPDGKRILFSHRKAEPGALQQIFAVDPDTKDPPELLSGQDSTRSITDPAYSPDGKKIAFVCGAPVAAKKKDNKNP
jgi:TolB protein